MEEEAIELKKEDWRTSQEEASAHWLHELYLTAPGAVTKEQLAMLVKKGFIKDAIAEQELLERDELEASLLIGDTDRYPLSIEEYLSRVPETWKAKWRNEEIRSKHWKPEAGNVFDKDFWGFIKSHHTRFCDLIAYEPFYLYIEQKRRWAADTVTLSDIRDPFERERFQALELARCKANTAYFADKYGWIKESGMGERGRKYTANLSHLLVMFLLDCGRCFLLLKGRQMALTSTIALVMVCRIITRTNYTIKFVAQDKEKTKEIFEDKVKHSFFALDPWLKPRMANDRDEWFRVSFTADTTKGESHVNMSSIRVVAPKADAVNGGSPDFVPMDEQAYTPLFEKMLKEGRPALSVQDPVTKKRKLTRQCAAWTTGGEDDRGNGAFEKEYRSCLGHWDKAGITGAYADFFIPLFFDWTCIPGATVEDYEREAKRYAAGTIDGQTERSVEERMIIFRQQWPSSIDDGFLSRASTLVPMATILSASDKIAKMQAKIHREYGKPLIQKGYLIPIHGTVDMPSGMFYKRNVIGAQWIPAADGDLMAPISILTGCHPKKNWSYRFYQGTDPIQHDSGNSKMASCIWDAQWGMPVAWVNFRTDDPNITYEQVALLGMYYAEPGKSFVPHLIENNFGAGYIDFISSPFFDRGLNFMVPTAALPDLYRTDGSNTGMRMSARTKYQVINVLKHIIHNHQTKLLLPEFWVQLRHFEQVGTAETPRWKTGDAEMWQDDLLIATPLAYICRETYSNRQPIELDEQKKKAVVPEKRLARDRDGNLTYAYQTAV